MEFFNIDSRLLETAKKAEEMASEQFAKISDGIRHYRLRLQR